MHVNQCDFKQAVWLNDRCGEGATEAVAYQTRVIIQTEQLRPFISPFRTKHAAQVKTYLTRERRLPSSLVDSMNLLILR